MPHLLQAGAVPFRLLGAEPQFLLVTSRQGHWIFPKGRVEPGHSAERTASKEAEEEAGVIGRLIPGPVGSYDDEKSWTPFHVLMYLLEYADDAPDWRESRNRARRWCSFEDAERLLKKKELVRILEAARLRILSLRIQGGAEGGAEGPGLNAPSAPREGGGSSA